MKTFVLSDESVNCYGYRVLTDGIDTSQFERNPVMLYSHDTERLPIGRWTNIRKEDGRLLADADFDLNDPFAAQIADKVENGIIRCCSIGFEIVSLSDSADLMLPGQRQSTVTGALLLECSVCVIGANRNAMVLKRTGTDETLQAGDILHLSMEISLEKNNNMDEQNNTLEQKVAALEQQLQEVGNEKATLSQQKSELETKVAELESQVADLSGKLEAQHKAEIAKLIDGAVGDGRIAEGQRPCWEALMAADFENASAALAELKAPTSLSAMMQGRTQHGENLAQEWDEADRQGRLAEIKQGDPDRFKQMYKARFGAEYTDN
ncbi:MAG: HK97 family phage prohead protease [Bacteroidales bacterium]|nr:HK97 family phage prohead protease [Bacteroidales bacterium]